MRREEDERDDDVVFVVCGCLFVPCASCRCRRMKLFLYQ